MRELLIDVSNLGDGCDNDDVEDGCDDDDHDAEGCAVMIWATACDEDIAWRRHVCTRTSGDCNREWRWRSDLGDGCDNDDVERCDDDDDAAGCFGDDELGMDYGEDVARAQGEVEIAREKGGDEHDVVGGEHGAHTMATITMLMAAITMLRAATIMLFVTHTPRA